MAHQNKWTTKRPRLRRLPAVAVTEEERDAIMAFHRYWRVSLAQIQRLGLIAAGFLDSTSLTDDETLPTELVRAAMAGKAKDTLPATGGKGPRRPEGTASRRRGRRGSGDHRRPKKFRRRHPRG